MEFVKKGYFKNFSFRLKGSFLSVLLLIQVLLISLSFIFLIIIVNTLDDWEKERSNTIADFVMKQLEQENSKTVLSVLAIAHNELILKLFSEHNRQKLYEAASPMWNKIKTYGLRQFTFYIPTSAGLQDFLLVRQPDVYGAYSSSYRPTLVKCSRDRELVFGLEQGKSGYGFRAVTPAYYKGKFIGCIDLGSEFGSYFLERLNKNHQGKWEIVNLVRGINILMQDKAVLSTLNISEEQAILNHLSVSENIMNTIKSGKIFYNRELKTNNVNLYIPIKNFSGDIVAYILHTYYTDYFSELKEAILVSVIICLFGLIISTLIILVLYRQITIPIGFLIIETEKIKNFQLDGKSEIDAKMWEIKNLVTSVENMKIGLNSFKKYVPSQLVRQLIETNQEAKISGQRKELTILFSDIANFTSISENMKPKDLTAQLSSYLDEITETILEYNGTVDKYIGDAVMAFWGAPIEIENKALSACLAAIHMQKRIHNLNEKWKSEGRPVFLTRIGVNTGDVIVGNIGSEQRLSYTVIGDAVNLASRLEGLNKNYKTGIIISHQTYRQCKNEIEVRILDFATVKGKSEVVTIYELIAERGDISAVDKDFYFYFTQSVKFYRNKEFEKAIKLFKHLIQKRPDDYPTQIFLERCIKFLKNPPPEDWQGNDID